MIPEVQALIDKAHASLQAARPLHTQGFSDFAASRAYYTMFYTAEALLLHRGQSFSSHSAVIAAFGREYAKSGEFDARFHRYLIDAQDLRLVSDYGTSTTLSASQSEEALRWAEEFLAASEAKLA